MRRVLLVLVTAALLLAPAAGAWSWPASGDVLQAFSFDAAHPYAAGQHRGIDVGGAAGSAVAAPASGTVTFAGSVPSSGLSVTIATPDGYSVTLTHLGSIAVTENATVAEGDTVGSIGPSGEPELAQPYVHIGVRLTAQAQGYLDPVSLLPTRAVAAPRAPAPVPAPAPASPPAGSSPAVAAPVAPAPAAPVTAPPAGALAPAPTPVAAPSVAAPAVAPHAAPTASAAGGPAAAAAGGLTVLAGARPVEAARVSERAHVSQHIAGATMRTSAAAHAPARTEAAPAAPRSPVDGPRTRVGRRPTPTAAPMVDAKARVVVPKAGVVIAPKAGVVIAPKADVVAPKADVVAPKANVVAPKARLKQPRARSTVPAQSQPPRPKVVSSQRLVHLLGAAVLGAALAALLGGAAVAVRRKDAPIIDADALLRDDTDLLRERQAAYRACVHDDRRGHPRAAPSPARRRDVLSHRRRRARDQGLAGR